MPVVEWASSVMMRGMQGNLEPVELVGDALVGDGEDARVAEHGLGRAGRGGIALIGRLHVGHERLLDRGQGLHEFGDDGAAAVMTILAAALAAFLAEEAEGALDLLGEGFGRGIQDRAHVIARVVGRDGRHAVVAREEHAAQHLHDAADLLAVGQGQVRALSLQGADAAVDMAAELLYDIGQTLFAGRHHMLSRETWSPQSGL